MLKKIINLLKAINSNSHPGEIAHAVCLAAIIGFMPKNNALWYILTVLFLFMRINKGAFILLSVVFSCCATFADPLLDNIGYQILTIPALEPFFSTFLNIPFMAFTKINYTIVMGALVSALVIYIPLYWLMRGFIKLWRATLAPALRKTKFIKFLSKVPLIQKASGVLNGSKN